MNKVTVTVAGPVGSGKSAICGEIEILCRALGLPVVWIDGQQEKNLTHADWTEALEMYKPNVTIVERIAHSVETDGTVDMHLDDWWVDLFAKEMKLKLANAREKGRGGWQDCDPAELSSMLREHVEKGDPRDVANFCMFLWAIRSPIGAAAIDL